MMRTVSWMFVATALAFGGGCGDDDSNSPDNDAGGSGGSGGGGSGGAGSGGAGSGGAGSGGDDGGGDVAVEIELEAVVGDDAFDCAQHFVVGTGDTMVMPLDFKLYVHDVELLTVDGAQALTLEQDGAFQDGTVALLDFEDDTGSCSNGTAPTHTKIVGTVPAGDYTGVRFKIGVPESRNHGNQATAPSPLNLEGMFWSWTTGYKFLRIDVAPMHPEMDDAGAMPDDDAGAGHEVPSGFAVHLGSTMCTGDPAMDDEVTCTRANRPEVSFASFDPEDQKIVINLAELLATSNVAHDSGGAPGCMSGGMDPECPAIFSKLGLDIATGESTGNPVFMRVANR
jgi:uncharacterized repeat protein (TIGR04052 family)